MDGVFSMGPAGGNGAVQWGDLDVGDFGKAAGTPSGAGGVTRPGSRGGACAREGIMPVSRGLRDNSFAGGALPDNARFATQLETTQVQTQHTGARPF
jgi:hypothetical protein